MARYDRSGFLLPRLLGQDYWDIFDYPSSLADQSYGDILDPFDWMDTSSAPVGYGERRNRRPFQRSLGYPLGQDQYSGTQLAQQQPQRTMQRQQQQQLGTQIQNDQNKFCVALDCRHFNPNEIDVTFGENNSVNIHGKHEERSDEHGYISREFTRRYVFPRECEIDKLNAQWKENGQLCIECPKQPQQQQIGQGKRVPIQGIENWQPQGYQHQLGQQGQQFGQQQISQSRPFEQSQAGQQHQVGHQIHVGQQQDKSKEGHIGQTDKNKESQAQLGQSHRQHQPGQTGNVEMHNAQEPKHQAEKHQTEKASAIRG